MLKTLITGVQGAGKTTVTLELAKHGYTVLDSDDISHWIDKDGTPLTRKRPSDPSTAWLQSHAWVCDQTKLRAYLANTNGQPTLLCGISWDQEGYYDLFDTIILLAMDEPTTRQRLLSRDNGNDFGKKLHELQLILERRESFQERAVAAGAVVIDGRKSLDVVVSEIRINLS
jgi:dephospho-CoA kinase